MVVVESIHKGRMPLTIYPITSCVSEVNFSLDMGLVIENDVEIEQDEITHIANQEILTWRP
jgi:hypothetical protein